MDLFVQDLQKDDSLQGIEHQVNLNIYKKNKKFYNLLESQLSDNEKLQIYYLMRDRLVIHRDNGSNEAIVLMTLMMNKPEVQEFMFRIADEESMKIQKIIFKAEAQVQQVRSLTLFNKPSMIKRKTVPPQEIQTFKQEETKVQEEPKQIDQIPKENIIILQQQEPEYDRLLRRAKQTMNETQLDEAYKFAVEALKLKESQNYKENQDFLEEIVQKYDYMIMNLKEMETDGWIPDAEKSGIKVKYKFVAGTSTASMIMETEVNVNAVRVLSLVNEADLNHLWVPFCMRTYVNKVINRACKVCTTEMYFPLIPNRETVFVGEGIDRLNVNGTIVLMSRSIQDDKQFQQRYDLNIPAKSKFVRMLIRYYLFEIKPITHDRCQIRAITNCDPFIHMVPNSVIAYIGRKFAHILIGKIVHYAKNFETSPFYPVFQEHREFYTWIEDKMNKYLQK